MRFLGFLLRSVPGAVLALFMGLSALAQQSANPSVAAAFQAGRDDNWDLAFALLPPGDDLARDLLIWTRLRQEDNGARFDDYLDFLPRRRDWPGMDRLRARGEEIIPPDLNPDRVIAWFDGDLPETGIGAVRLAAAMIARGNAAGAEAMLREVWLTESLSDEGHEALIAAHADTLRPLHGQRADAMLWRWRKEDAARTIELLTGDEQALYAARLAFLTKAPDATQTFNALPTRLRADVGLAYDRFNWLADRGDWTEAVAVLKSHSTRAEDLGQPFRWSGWRRTLARWEMREGRYQSAYDLASQHFLTADDGESYADLEWLSGYLALRWLDRPGVALRHFERMAAAVDGPISEGRAGYWIGRTHEALGNEAAAVAAYTHGAQHQTSFYGLLAAEKLGQSLDPALTGSEVFPDWQSAPFLGEEKTRAALTLLSAGERVGAVLFFAELGRELDRTELAQLGEILVALDESFYAVLLGKAGVARGLMVPAIYYPDHPLSRKDIPVSAELAMSIARRESEFRTDAGSAVGALGLMQVMPGTAEDMADDLGLAYSRGRLTSDWDYNASLGARYLELLEQEFGPSPVFIAAGYNAGPRRPRDWIAERGDPRTGEIDVIDWIEMIPFRETRNYVQRVAESIPVYRARLTGQTGQIRFTAMLVGEKPVIRPVARPAERPVTGDPAETPVPAVTAAPATNLAPVVSLRPVARP
ncbi:lytic transglycosylase domain-containing protein [Loktanella sp. IMCC34160]|uniref:lytic transglycosylase domain-containing protein n=1 Tax=Loktanella sp. IMCC34160 TaxID=2510646 RepID=UPI001F5D1658|nr:lytic transglycosylase domain-containing protein [Loktanella sp. IMCC34160]